MQLSQTFRKLMFSICFAVLIWQHESTGRRPIAGVWAACSVLFRLATVPRPPPTSSAEARGDIIPGESSSVSVSVSLATARWVQASVHWWSGRGGDGVLFFTFKDQEMIGNRKYLRKRKELVNDFCIIELSVDSKATKVVNPRSSVCFISAFADQNTICYQHL